MSVLAKRLCNGVYEIGGAVFTLGDEADTPDGYGWITGFDRDNGKIAVHLAAGPVRWYRWMDVSL